MVKKKTKNFIVVTGSSEVEREVRTQPSPEDDPDMLTRCPILKHFWVGHGHILHPFLDLLSCGNAA